MSERIENLATKWDQAVNTMLGNGEFNVATTEELLRETYKLCTEYKDATAVPKAFCKMFTHIAQFCEILFAVCEIDEFTTPSDAAEYDAITTIIEEIDYGFYEGTYENRFPYISAQSSNGKTYTLNLEEAFLEEFIDNNR